MIKCQSRIKKEQLKSKMILQIHDELIFDVPKNEENTMKKIIREEMENAASLDVKLKVDIGTGDNWLEAH